MREISGHFSIKLSYEASLSVLQMILLAHFMFRPILPLIYF